MLSASACAAQQAAQRPAASPAPMASVVTPIGAPARPSGPHFWNAAGIRLGHPSVDAIRNVNGSPRIEAPALYDQFYRDYAKIVEQTTADHRVNLNPNFIVALVAKESGFDPKATSSVPAYGIAQMTHIADLDLQEISREANDFKWMNPDVKSWPRMKAVHDSAATKARIDSLVARGIINARTEYLFDPRTALRGSMYWLRILGTIWTGDEWPGMYGSLAKQKLGTRPDGQISESDLLSLVIVSYNQGAEYVAGLVKQYGRDWTKHLNAESSDYLDRILLYTDLFERAGR